MSSGESHLDAALSLMEEEIESLARKDEKRAQELLDIRQRHMEKAFADQAVVRKKEFQDKLARMQVLQNRLMVEARELHSLLKKDLLRLRGHSRMLSGYREGAKIIPMASKYISRIG